MTSASPSRIADLSIVVVHHRTPHLLGGLLDALCSDLGPVSQNLYVELIIVDNSAHGAGTPRPEFEELRRRELGPLHLEVHELPRNEGFGSACNRGVERTAAPLVLLLNPDVRISLAAARRLAAELESDPRRGATGCKLLADDGCAEPTWSPRLRFFTEVARRRFWRRWQERLPPAVQRAEAMQASARTVPWLTAACLLLRREAFVQIGGFDERYFLYYEDIDLGEALRKAGWHLWYTPAATARHARGASTSALPGLAQLRRNSRRLFYRKWGSPLDRLALMLFEGLRRVPRPEAPSH